MSIEKTLEELKAAILGLTAALQASGHAQPATLYVPVSPVVSNAAPAALPNGMPGGPFGTPAPAAAAAPSPFAAPAAPGVPFTDIASCTKYAMEAYGLLEGKAAGRGEVITQLINHLCGSNNLNDLPVASYPAFYAELEKQKAA